MDYRIAISKLSRFAQSVEHDVPVTLTEIRQLWNGYGQTSAPVEQAYTAAVGRFEMDDVYLYRHGNTSRKSGRATCNCFVIPKGLTLTERDPQYSIRYAIAKVLGGNREEQIGLTKIFVYVGLNSHATEVVAKFSLVWSPPDGIYNPSGNSLHFESTEPETIAVARASLYNEAPILALIDFLQDHAPEIHRAKLAKAAEHCAMERISQLEAVCYEICLANKTEAAHQAFASYDMGDMVVAGANGWENQGPDEWSQVFFVDGDGPSQRLVFVVRFRPGTSEVDDAYIAH